MTVSGLRKVRGELVAEVSPERLPEHDDAGMTGLVTHLAAAGSREMLFDEPQPCPAPA